MAYRVPLVVGVASTNPSKLVACARALRSIFPKPSICICVHEREGAVLGERVRVIASPFSVSHVEEHDQSGGITVIGVSVDSGVSCQPLTAEETLRGARTRAQRLWETIRATENVFLENPSQSKTIIDPAGFDFCVGLEGGIEVVDDVVFESGYIVVQARDGVTGIGTSARFQIADHIHQELHMGVELADVVDRLSGKTDVRSSQGMMGMITNGVLSRDLCYEHGVIFAFSRFFSPKQYWERP